MEALKEIEYGLDTLKADGVAMYTSYDTKWLGDPGFNPVFDELNRRGAVVYTHPKSAACCKNVLPNISDSEIEYGTDTTRAITEYVFGGTARRCPNVRIIFSHAGGTMPFLIERFVNLAKSPAFAAQLPQGFLAEATKFYYDTAQTANAAAMSALLKVVPVSQVVFGTDFPFRTAADHVKGLKECGVFSAKDLQAIDRENAARLFPRYKNLTPNSNLVAFLPAKTCHLGRLTGATNPLDIIQYAITWATSAPESFILYFGRKPDVGVAVRLWQLGEQQPDEQQFFERQPERQCQLRRHRQPPVRIPPRHLPSMSSRIITTICAPARTRTKRFLPPLT